MGLLRSTPATASPSFGAQRLDAYAVEPHLQLEVAINWLHADDVSDTELRVPHSAGPANVIAVDGLITHLIFLIGRLLFTRTLAAADCPSGPCRRL